MPFKEVKPTFLDVGCYSAEMYANLSTLYVRNATEPEFAALDIRVTLRKDISPATRWLISYANEEETRKFLTQLNAGEILRMQDDLDTCVNTADLSEESKTWYQMRADLINQYIDDLLQKYKQTA